MELTAQVDLTGEEITYDKERVETWKDVLKAKYYQLSVSEDMHAKIDGWHENGKEFKLRAWIASHMKPWQTLPEGKEGEAYQQDMALFIRIL